MFPWYIDASLVLGVLAVFGAIWSVGGHAHSVRPPLKVE